MYGCKRPDFVLFQGTTPQAEALARGIGQKVRELIQIIHHGISNVESGSIQQPAHTLCGRIEQARAFLSNPAFDDNGLGIYFILFISTYFVLTLKCVVNFDII